MIDRPDCPQLGGICRSPHSCANFNCCIDRLKPEVELKLLGYGSAQLRTPNKLPVRDAA